MLICKACVRSSVEAICAHFHLMLAICDYMSRNGSCPQRVNWKSVALPLQSYRSTAAGVSSSAPPLLSSRLLLSPPSKPHIKVTCCHLLAVVENAPLKILPHFTSCFYTHVSLCSVINVKPSCPAGIPTLTIAITIPSCSSRPCWPAMSHSHPIRR